MARPPFRFRMHPIVIANQCVKGERCRDCKRFLYPTAGWFHKDKNRPDGFQLYCKPCKRARDRASYERHLEARLASARAWKSTHRQQLDGWRRVYNGEYRRGMRRRPIRPGVSAERTIEVKLCSSCGGSFDPTAFGKGKRECRACWNARQPKYRNPIKRAVHHQNRRARMVGKVSADEWRAVLERFEFRCAYCGAAGKLTMDHVQPLAKGGRHEPSNLVPACPTCNSRKHTRLWRPATQFSTSADSDSAAIEEGLRRVT